MQNNINAPCLIFRKILGQISNELTDIENLGKIEAKKHLSKDVQLRFRGLIMRNPISLQFPKKTRLNWNLLTRMIEFLKILKDIIWLLQVWRKLRSLEHFVYRPGSSVYVVIQIRLYMSTISASVGKSELLFSFSCVSIEV